MHALCEIANQCNRYPGYREPTTCFFKKRLQPVMRLEVEQWVGKSLKRKLKCQRSLKRS